ncbi:MAG: DNA repair protein RecO [Bdellovibrionota bacterium]
MHPQRDLAIVLRSIPYEERHRIVTALTENHGVITALARNSIQSRRFGGTLEPFCASEWHFTRKPGADMVHLSEAHAKRSYEGLRKDFERLSLASALNETLLKLTLPEEASPELFRLHTNALAALEELPAIDSARGADLAILNGYLAKVLQWSGSQPNLQNCLDCALPMDSLPFHEPVTCLVSEAAWICVSCRSRGTRHIRARADYGHSLEDSMIRVAPAAILDFYLSLTMPIKQVPAKMGASREEHRELFRFLEALFVFHIPGFDRQPLKSLRFLDLESSVRLPAANPRQNSPRPV